MIAVKSCTKHKNIANKKFRIEHIRKFHMIKMKIGKHANLLLGVSIS